MPVNQRHAASPEIGEERAPRRSELDRVAAVRLLCPYLSDDGHRIRRTLPVRDHRCTAVRPAARVSLEKQHRLCLAADHIACATYVAASAARGRLPEDADLATRWGFTRTVPAILEQGRLPSKFAVMTRDRRGPQVALAMVMVLALGAVVLARLPDGVNRAGALDPTPSATVLESPVSPRVSPIPTTSATPRPSPTPEPSASPEPTEAAPETYTVRSGDTLSAIAARYGTTVAVLQELNGIVDASKIRIGQVIRLP